MKHCVRETNGWKGVAHYYTRHIVDFFGFPTVVAVFVARIGSRGI